MNKSISVIMGGMCLGLICLSILAYTHRNLAGLFHAALMRRLPAHHHLSHIRNSLLFQKRFRDLLADHEKQAIIQFQQTGNDTLVKRYVYRTSIAMFDLPSFSDDWVTWVRTDIVDSRPQTSFLIRLGLIGDHRSGRFFGSQCDTIVCNISMKTLGMANHAAFDLGLLKPFRLNITESDDTSSISRKRLRVSGWKKMVEQRHQTGLGISFSDSST